MATSVIDLQRDLILSTIKATSGDDWKVLVLDEKTQNIVYNVVKEDDILNANITNIEQIEKRRQNQSDTDAIYILTPSLPIVQILKFDLSRRRYRRYFLIWTSPLPPFLEHEIFSSEGNRKLVASSTTLNIEYYPAESHLITFREPWSFHMLYHPGCDTLIKDHLQSLTQKVLSVCVALGEYPLVKYYKPQSARHEAAVLCSHLASFVQQALDEFARDPRNDFPPPSTPANARPRGVLFITDRSMDLMSPLIHELTYQAMAMDLLPIRDDGLKLTYRNVIRKGTPEEEEKDVELSDKDNLWVKHRHLHMKDLLVELSEQFRKFQAANPQFADNPGKTANINTIKDMIAGLPEFQLGKEAFSLHIDMAEKLAKMFAERKLMDVVALEQCLAIGLDEENKPPKNMAGQLVQLLDDDSVVHEDRVRLLMLYILFRNGILAKDIEKLRRHGQLSPTDGEVIYNMVPLGVKVQKDLKEPPALKRPLFFPKLIDTTGQEEVSLSRFEPALKYMLEDHSNDKLDANLFPPVKPHLEAHGAGAQLQQQTSLRSSAKPTWAQNRTQTQKPQQRIIVFMAGGATYAEARACYELSRGLRKDIFLATTHMQTPKSFLRQMSMLSASRKRLELPVDQPPPTLPAWLSEPPPQPKPPPQQQQPPASSRPVSGAQPPVNAMAQMKLGEGGSQNGARPDSRPGTAGTTGTDNGKGKKEKEKHTLGGLFKRHK